MKTNRRTFLKSSMACIAAAALPSCSNTKEEEVKSKPKKDEKSYAIVERTLGRTGIKIPIISMGAVAEDKAVYTAALDVGIKHIDTDYLYRRGRHEKLVGEIIKDRPRESLIVATKVNVRSDGRTGLYPEGTRGDALLKPFEKSMKRLGVEHLDILYLHSVSTAAALTYGPIVETLQKLKNEGRTRYLGVSVAYAAEAGLGIVAMKTQAGAFLDRKRTKPVNHKAAIKWVLSDTNVHTSIPGFKNIEEMEMYLSVMGDLKLTPEEKADLDSARHQAGLYCLQCGRCVPQCPHGVIVPSYMRAFMYAYGYKNPGKAKETITKVSPRDPPCGQCASCSVSCVMGFDVKTRILDIARVRSIPEDFLFA